MTSMGEVRSLAVYLPGSCEQLVDEWRGAFGEELTAARVAMTGVLAEEVLAGAPADVVVSANDAYLARLAAAGYIPRPQAFARNRLALFVRPDAVDRVRTISDLVRDDVRTLVFPAENDPCGAYTVELFERAGISAQMALQKVAGCLIILEHGGPTMDELFARDRIDVLVAYRTIAKRLPDLQIVDLPPSLDLRDRIVFTAGAVTRAGSSHPRAQAFVDFLSGKEHAPILARHGFLPM